jgi:uncharacterized protein (TIGR02145 family)
MKPKIRIYIGLLLNIFYISLIVVSCKKKDALIISPITFNPSITYGSMTDQDGNTYKTVRIGTQTWMAENLKTTIYRNGDPIPKVTNNNEWISLTTGAYCFYNNDIPNQVVYGILYNWFTVKDNRNLAPLGWHIPDQVEWNALITYLGGGQAACITLRENGTTHWLDYKLDNANQSGFTGLPAGYRDYMKGIFYGINYYGWWWSTDIDEGLQLVDTALKLVPENYNFLHIKGWGLYKQGKYQEAVEILQKSWDIRREKAVYNHEAFLHLEAANKAVANQKNN